MDISFTAVIKYKLIRNRILLERLPRFDDPLPIVFFMCAPTDSLSVCLCFFCAQSRLGFERFAHKLQPLFDPCAIMAGLEGAFGQLGNPLHLFVERLPAARVGRQAADDMKRAEHACHDGDIACGAAPDLIERFGQQVFKGRNDGDHTQRFSLVTVR